MNVHIKLIQYSLPILIGAFSFGENVHPTRYDMLHYLLKELNYDNNFPPDTENVTDVSVELNITDFNLENDKDREIEFTLNIRMNWTDVRLNFTANDTTFNVITLGDDIVNSLWIPDLYFIQERKSILHSLFTDNQLVYIYKNGSIFYSGRFNVRSSCTMDLTKYPFDTQTCRLEIQSYAFTTNYIILHWHGGKPINKDISIKTINVDETTLYQTTETRYKYPNIGEFSTLKAAIILSRNERSYWLTSILPTVCVVLIAFSSFLLGDNVSSRITIPTGALTQLFVQWQGTYDRVSPDSSLLYLDILMFGNLICLGSILAANAVICHYKYLEPETDNDQTNVKQRMSHRNNSKAKYGSMQLELLSEQERSNDISENEGRVSEKVIKNDQTCFEKIETKIKTYINVLNGIACVILIGGYFIFLVILILFWRILD